MTNETNWNDVVTDCKLLAARKKRGLSYEEVKVRSENEADQAKKGWRRHKLLSKGKWVQMRREKEVGFAFEDKVWMMFARMGFANLNATRKFTIHFSQHGHQQIDVFAVDRDCAIIVECKTAESEGSKKVFKKDIDALGGQKEALAKVVRDRFHVRSVKFIWATKNIRKSKADEGRLDDYGIVHFDEKTISYFNDLAMHLGSAAKYQLFARLFKSEQIPNLDNRVYAIRSIMGNVKCYMFAIEPARLLKLGYILHHHPINEDMMPAYQRLIKKPRLNQIRKFVERKGYFANSVIVSIDTDKKPLAFEVLGEAIAKSVSRIGILKLPKKYHSVYVIDGQHRLYAYSDSPLSETHTIPVVAFENLERGDQLKLFMDINENQKSVSKSLRATLSSTMLWDSVNPDEQRTALTSKIAQRLEELDESPLSGRIIVGENEPSAKRKVTINAIQDALKKSGLLTKYAKAKGKFVPADLGLLDFEDNGTTFKTIFPFILECFCQMEKKCPAAWAMTDEQHTILVTNRGIQAVIRVFGDVVRHLHNKKVIKDPKSGDAKKLARRVINYMEPLFSYINDISEADRKSLRLNLGANADNTFLHEFQRVIKEKHADFSPEGLAVYLSNETKQYNAETSKKIKEIRDAVIKSFDKNFWGNLSDDECLKKFSKKAYQRISRKISEYDYEHNEGKGNFRMFVSFSELQALALEPKMWAVFEVTLSDPEAGKKAAKRKKTAWMAWLDGLAKKLSKKTYSVPEPDAQKVSRIHNWVVGK